VKDDPGLIKVIDADDSKGTVGRDLNCPNMKYSTCLQ
jgi:hypothetical protein